MVRVVSVVVGVGIASLRLVWYFVCMCLWGLEYDIIRSIGRGRSGSTSLVVVNVTSTSLHFFLPFLPPLSSSPFKLVPLV